MAAKTGRRWVLIACTVGVFFLMLTSMYYYFSGQRYAETMVSYTADAHLTLVIDPGHGGADGGAVSGDSKESALNLAIALKLETLAALYGIPAVLTRSSEELEYPADAATIRAKKVADTHGRVELIRGTDCAVLLSIHQNIFDAASVSGPQVLFAATTASEAFAQSLQDTLTAAVRPERVRAPVAVSRDVYIMNHIDCPAILVECGFLSNPEEARLLQTDAYQVKLAAAMAASYLECAEQLGARYWGGAVETAA